MQRRLTKILGYGNILSKVYTTFNKFNSCTKAYHKERFCLDIGGKYRERL